MLLSIDRFSLGLASAYYGHVRSTTNGRFFIALSNIAMFSMLFMLCSQGLVSHARAKEPSNNNDNKKMQDAQASFTLVR